MLGSEQDELEEEEESDIKKSKFDDKDINKSSVSNVISHVSLSNQTDSGHLFFGPIEVDFEKDDYESFHQKVDKYLEENQPEMKSEMTDGFEILVSKKPVSTLGLDYIKNIKDYRQL